MFWLLANLAPLFGDNAGPRAGARRQAAGDGIKDARPETATLAPHRTAPGPDDFGLDIFGGP